jgi:peptide/nickel transport system permease protein
MEADVFHALSTPSDPEPEVDEGSPTTARKRRIAWPIVIPATVLGLVVLASLIGPFFTGDPNKNRLREARLGLFSHGHLLGTDAFGRDILSRVLHGGRTSLLVGLCVVLLCMIVGGGFGMIAGYRGGLADTLIMRTNDMILAFPALVLALTIAAYLGPSIRNVVLAVAFAMIPQYARLGRATALSLRDRDFVLSSKLMGGTERHTIGRHIVPNVLIPMLAYGLLAIGIAIIIEASLSFLGLGVQPPTASWGAAIAEGRPDLQRAPQIALAPGVMLFITIFSLNLLADAVRAHLDHGSTVATG